MAEIIPQLALGTAQWGMAYGIANTDGRPSFELLRRMVALALGSSVDVFDTAPAYGESEVVLGRLMSELSQPVRVVTKLGSDVCDPTMSVDEATARARASLNASRRALRTERIDTLLLHRAEHRTCCGGVVWEWLRTQRSHGRIRKLGISARTPDEAIDALDDPDVEVMQVASSLLDQRLARRGFFTLARERGKEVHVRSVFLQGVAFLSPEALPGHLKAARAGLALIAEFESDMRADRGRAWLLYGRTLPTARLVLGSETTAQLESNLEGFLAPIPPEVRELASRIPPLPDDVLDPSRWPQ
jgi:aryl-alcohol dehydrogenase-like predicted oxidoreductase